MWRIEYWTEPAAAICGSMRKKKGQNFLVEGLKQNGAFGLLNNGWLSFEILTNGIMGMVWVFKELSFEIFFFKLFLMKLSVEKVCIKSLKI